MPLIAAPEEIFDTDGILRALSDALADPVAGDPMAVRKAAIDVLSDARDRGREAIRLGFEADPTRARRVTKSYAFLTDRLVQCAWLVATRILHPRATAEHDGDFAVIGVGGYGRGEMAPHSDVDLLFLTGRKVTPWVESVVESMLYILWDLKLKVGHATRTIKECVRLGTEDFTIRTSLLERRLICGEAPLADVLADRLWEDLFLRTVPEFIDAKLQERSVRHRKQGGQRYILEPNVKEAKGGLRDLQALYWIAKYRYRVGDPAALLSLGVFTEDEFEAFEAAERFLWCVRCHMHLIAGRAADMLTFDMQVDVAAAMGYRDHAGRRGVEHFMQDYFRHATSVGELTRILLVALEADNIKQEPGLMGFFKRRRRVKTPYVERQGRLDVVDEAAFLGTPLNMLGIFEEALRTGLLLHPHAMRLMAANRHLIDRDLREDPEAAKIFLGLLLKLRDTAPASLPAGAVPYSPWCDMTQSGETFVTNADTGVPNCDKAVG